MGASQTVIGSRQVPELLSQIPEEVRSRVKRQSCNPIFRFGNQQTLVSKHALMMALGETFFRIAVVEGNTPFLISSSFLKGIQAVIDTDKETMWSKTLNREINIDRNHKNLFLMDLNQLWLSEEPAQLTVPARSETCLHEVPRCSEAEREGESQNVNKQTNKHHRATR